MLGLRMQSWALWVAEALHMPYTCLAVNGARAQDALSQQVPRLAGPYDLGCVYIGVNDVRSTDWDADAYRSSVEQILAAVRGSSRAVLALRLPPALGNPPAHVSAIAEANRTIAAAAAGAVVVDLASLRGPELVQPDLVHLTARGEAHVARLVIDGLRRAGASGIDETEIDQALEPLTAVEAARYALTRGAMARLRDWRRRTSEAREARRLR
jgi:hypothetical protein